MNRLEKTFANAKSEGRKALVTFTMAGDPDAATALDILIELAKSADILEIGMPFTDPMADGPAIQAAGLRSLANGGSLRETLLLAQKFRSKNSNTPLILMGYINPILAYGIDNFINESRKIGIDGFIIVDVPPEEADEIAAKVQQKNMAFIRLLTPTTDAARLPRILANASGFLYYVSVAGVTGATAANPNKAGAHIAEIKKHTDLPVVAGFGIKTPEDAAAMAKMADGVVVGSALVQQIAMAKDQNALPDLLGRQAAALAKALKSAA